MAIPLKNLLIIFSFIFTTFPAFADEPIIIGQKGVLPSKILGEDRPYFVHLPASYDDKDYQSIDYPVLYILDGEVYFYTVTGVVEHMSSSNIQIPEMIVVAISNTGPDEGADHDNRTRDLTPTHATTEFGGKNTDMLDSSGGGDKFLAFIEKELIPKIDATYRTRKYRTLVGHSFGGLTVLHSFLTQPGLFQNYVSIDASLWWDSEILNKRVQEFVANNKDIKARVFMSNADYKAEDMSSMRISNMRFAEQLQKAGIPGLDVKLQKFPGESHGSVPLVSLYYGLLYDFAGYAPTIETYYGGVEATVALFKVFSERVGMEFLPPEHMIDSWAESFAGNPDKARGYLELNVANYPESTHAKTQLSDFNLRKISN